MEMPQNRKYEKTASDIGQLSDLTVEPWYQKEYKWEIFIALCTDKEYTYGNNIATKH